MWATKMKNHPLGVLNSDSSDAEDSIVLGRYTVSGGNTSRYVVTLQKTWILKGSHCIIGGNIQCGPKVGIQ